MQKTARSSFKEKVKKRYQPRKEASFMENSIDQK